jgi:hypothetical protein
MNGELAQVIAIATYGTVWLRDGSGEPPDLAAGDNSTFNFVRSAQFGADGAGLGVGEWLLRQRSQGKRRLWLFVPDPAPRRPRWPYLDAHIEAGFSNGGRWLLVAGEKAREALAPLWNVADLKSPDRRIWVVRYTGEQLEGQIARPPMAGAHARLVAALTAAQEFAVAVNEQFWADQFSGALTGTGRHELHGSRADDQARRGVTRALRRATRRLRGDG